MDRDSHSVVLAGYPCDELGKMRLRLSQGPRLVHGHKYDHYCRLSPALWRSHDLAPPLPVAGEDQLHMIGSADVEVVGDHGLEEPSGSPGCVEQDGAGGFDLPRRELPPVAGRARGLRGWCCVEHLRGAGGVVIHDALPTQATQAGHFPDLSASPSQPSENHPRPSGEGRGWPALRGARSRQRSGLQRRGISVMCTTPGPETMPRSCPASRRPRRPRPRSPRLRSSRRAGRRPGSRLRESPPPRTGSPRPRPRSP